MTGEVQITEAMVLAGRDALYRRRYARIKAVFDGPGAKSLEVSPGDMGDDARACIEAALAARAPDAVGAAEAEVGRYVYRRIEALMDAAPGTADGAELTYLSAIAESVEEYGEEHCQGHPVAPFADPSADALRAENERLREAVIGIDDDYMVSDAHHPHHVLIPVEKFEQLRTAARQSLGGRDG